MGRRQALDILGYSFSTSFKIFLLNKFPELCPDLLSVMLAQTLKKNRPVLS